MRTINEKIKVWKLHQELKVKVEAWWDDLYPVISADVYGKLMIPGLHGKWYKADLQVIVPESGKE